MDKNMANRMCCDLDIRDYYTKAPIMRVDFCNATTYGFNSDAVFANRKGAKAIKFESPLEGNIDITFQVHPFKVYSLLNGGQVLTDALLVRRENITASVDGKLTLQHSPIMGSVFVYTEDDFTRQEIQGSVAGNTFTSQTTSDIKVDQTYVVGYLEKKTDGVKRIAFNNRNYSSVYYIQMITTNKDEDGNDVGMRLIAYKCCPKRELEIQFSSDDSPAEITMSFECFQDENGNVMDIVKIEDSDSEEVEDIWINFATGTLETYSPTYYIQNGYLLQNEVKEDGY
ncbi:hypothetical protein [Longibaculum muris]|uniref:hypothetical protein n=1 Tax=Longibaculum muris TaxID=1796628 RepID=UPI003AB7F3A9